MPTTIDAAFESQSPRTSTPTAPDIDTSHENAFDSTESNFATNSSGHDVPEPIEDEMGSREQKALAILNASFENEDGFDSSLQGETDSQNSFLVTQTGSVETTQENSERSSLQPEHATTNVAPDLEETNGSFTPSQEPEDLPQPPEDLHITTSPLMPIVSFMTSSPSAVFAMTSSIHLPPPPSPDDTSQMDVSVSFPPPPTPLLARDEDTPTEVYGQESLAGMITNSIQFFHFSVPEVEFKELYS